MRRLILAGLCLWLAACAHRPAETALRLPDLRLPDLRLPPAAFGHSVGLAQRLTLTRPGKDNDAQQSLDVLLEIDPAKVKLAAFALNQRILTLDWDGTRLHSERHPRLPAEVDAERVLRDLQWALWPAEAIRAGLPAGWTLEDSAGQRVLRHAGQVQLRIGYSGTPRWQGKLELHNLLQGYRLGIESTEQ
ncbi:DUF3261 domain-containing protein [Chitinimonas arctica]|uniref:DUF3261 domain-containing protein n=1 Tax=Chitinimonas arctica TaxID=2594795 RepID=UPI0015D2B85D|nr:DUF3261 domain-containing protein [Chitinimonas arctica]